MFSSRCVRIQERDDFPIVGHLPGFLTLHMITDFKSPFLNF